jgi:uncharacterized protein (DUF362 family)
MSFQADGSRVGLARLRETGSSLQAAELYAPGITSRLIREALGAAGLGMSDPNAPLADLITPGMTVLLKPNWVLHKNIGGHGTACMVTHPAFLLEVLREVARARPGRVVIGDAPISTCEWNQILTPEFRVRMEALASASDVQLEFVDFRRTTALTDCVGNGFRTEIRDESRYVRFDLTTSSLLEPVSHPGGRFRITNYDPRILSKTHAPGRHQYLLCREAFEADVILSLPKLKTHCKAGLTGALKNLVGLNGNKENLPHHRVGGTAWGGDCYRGLAPRKRLAEFCLDHANRLIGQPGYEVWHRLAFARWRGFGAFDSLGVEGAWHGNDTVWRMVLDLNRILLYGRTDGTMADDPQRRLYSLTDAIICGEGEGPLAPRPRTLGAVTFASSAPAADAVHAILLGFDPQRIALVRESFGNFRWPLGGDIGEVRAVLGDVQFSLDELADNHPIDALPPRGWIGHIERRSRSQMLSGARED